MTLVEFCPRCMPKAPGKDTPDPDTTPDPACGVCVHGYVRARPDATRRFWGRVSREHRADPNAQRGRAFA